MLTSLAPIISIIKLCHAGDGLYTSLLETWEVMIDDPDSGSPSVRHVSTRRVDKTPLIMSGMLEAANVWLRRAEWR
jgi:hypothetical protein